MHNATKINQTLKIIREKFNFKASVIIEERQKSDEYFFFELAPLFVQTNPHNIFTIFNFYERKFALILSTGEEYSPFEKLILPFYLEVWISIGITFSIRFLAIKTLKTRHTGLQMFVFGLSVKTPAFNTLVVFFKRHF